MKMANPNITFLFPFRWMTEDKEYFGENVKRMIISQHGNKIYDSLAEASSYRVQIHYQYKQAIPNFPFTKTTAEKVLKPFFKYAQCIGVNITYEQADSETMLPLCDFRIFYK